MAKIIPHSRPLRIAMTDIEQVYNTIPAFKKRESKGKGRTNNKLKVSINLKGAYGSAYNRIKGIKDRKGKEDNTERNKVR